LCCTDRRRDAPRRLLSVSLGRANVVSFVCGLQVILREIVSEFLRIPRTFKLVQRGVSVCSLVRPTAILQPRPNCLFCIPVYLVCHHTFAESARADLRNSLREQRSTQRISGQLPVGCKIPQPCMNIQCRCMVLSGRNCLQFAKHVDLCIDEQI